MQPITRFMGSTKNWSLEFIEFASAWHEIPCWLANEATLEPAHIVGYLTMILYEMFPLDVVSFLGFLSEVPQYCSMSI